MLGVIMIAVVVTLLLSICIVMRAWFKGEYGIAVMAFLIVVLMLCSLPILGKLLV